MGRVDHCLYERWSHRLILYPLPSSSSSSHSKSTADGEILSMPLAQQVHVLLHSIFTQIFVDPSPLRVIHVQPSTSSKSISLFFPEMIDIILGYLFPQSRYLELVEMVCNRTAVGVPLSTATAAAPPLSSSLSDSWSSSASNEAYKEVKERILVYVTAFLNNAIVVLPALSSTSSASSSTSLSTSSSTSSTLERERKPNHSTLFFDRIRSIDSTGFARNVIKNTTYLTRPILLQSTKRRRDDDDDDDDDDDSANSTHSLLITSNNDNNKNTDETNLDDQRDDAGHDDDNISLHRYYAEYYYDKDDDDDDDPRSRVLPLCLSTLGPYQRDRAVDLLSPLFSIVEDVYWYRTGLESYRPQSHPPLIADMIGRLHAHVGSGKSLYFYYKDPHPHYFGPSIHRHFEAFVAPTLFDLFQVMDQHDVYDFLNDEREWHPVDQQRCQLQHRHQAQPQHEAPCSTCQCDWNSWRKMKAQRQEQHTSAPMAVIRTVKRMKQWLRPYAATAGSSVPDCVLSHQHQLHLKQQKIQFIIPSVPTSCCIS